LKDAARLLAYLAATLLFGALTAPVLFWLGQAAAAHGWASALAAYDFDQFFHRALLLGALIFFWPLLRWLRIRKWHELGLAPNLHPRRDTAAGFLIAAVPLLCLAGLLLATGLYSLRFSASFLSLLQRTLASCVVPLIEEPLFRGLILGVLLRTGAPIFATFVTSALFSVLHFLKPAEQSPHVVTWTSGFTSIANSFGQFEQPLLVLAGFSTLFLLGWILADARIRTRSLWLPIGLHAGWIFTSAMFNKVAHREFEALPWIGRSLLIGIAPLGVALISWGLLRLWLRHVESN
jgi:CAAX protease family protein